MYGCCWSRQVSVVSSQKGGLEFFALPTAHITGRCSFEGRTNNAVVLNCCRFADSHFVWTSLALGNIKVNIEYYYYSDPQLNLPRHSLCTVLVPVCSYG